MSRSASTDTGTASGSSTTLPPGAECSLCGDDATTVGQGRPLCSGCKRQLRRQNFLG